MARAMNSYLAFYRLHVQGNDDEELDAATEALLHASLGIEKGALAHFFDHVHHLLPDFGELAPHLQGAVWLGLILGLEAATNAREDASWVEDTSDNPAELLARAEQSSDKKEKG
jgi:hypothetical protein